MRFGPMRPVGIVDKRTGKRPYAVLQLRQENSSADMYNLVGFQTSLAFGEQKRVFGIIPALKNAEFLRYGVMHRNSFINSPNVLSKSLELKDYKDIFVAGQLSGVEGYVESIMTGLIAAKSCIAKIDNTDTPKFDQTTMIGALLNYITTKNSKFAPMNANFGLLPPLDNMRDKYQRKQAYYDRSIKSLKQTIDSL